MSMVNFDENQIIANGAKIYDQRAKIEAIADSIVDNGFDLLLFTSSGGVPGAVGPVSQMAGPVRLLHPPYVPPAGRKCTVRQPDDR